AESCTGGLTASMLTDVPGASEFFHGGVVAYDNRVKERVLGVPTALLESVGAVSEEVARAMALGVRALCGTDFGLAITGIAGPSGGTPEKPVGLVYGSVAGPDGEAMTYRMQFRGSREQIRIRAAKSMLWRLWQAAQEGHSAQDM
ncbi:MAG: nicotinamide-nucleotide amidohydrolase family protein, partial [Alicyclobacillus sp.]|nr:nicotinamide-nucleotide amidohydrolase family protein [Alicyclobacillus sp.]